MPALPAGVTLVVGEEELLVERAVRRATTTRARTDTGADTGADPAAGVPAPDEVTDLAAAALQVGDLADALSPSLFGGRRAVVLRDAHTLDKERAEDVLRVLAGLLSSPVEDTVAVVTHTGGARNRALLDGLERAGATVVSCGKVSPGDRRDFVISEVRAAGRRIEPAAAAALVASVGGDLRDLATASSQLAADVAGPLDEAAVARYHRGRADVSGFTVADRAVEGDVAGALEMLRWAAALGVAPVLVTSSLAANLRLIARVAGSGRSQPAAIAKSLGEPAWKVERAMRWSRGWAPAHLATAVAAVATADGQVKGAAVDANYAVERAVVAVASARSARAFAR